MGNDRTLIDEQRRWREPDFPHEGPNIGNDRLLLQLRRVHGRPRWDVPPQLTRQLDVAKLLRTLKR
jgi:hypothetical protein